MLFLQLGGFGLVVLLDLRFCSRVADLRLCRGALALHVLQLLRLGFLEEGLFLGLPLRNGRGFRVDGLLCSRLEDLGRSQLLFGLVPVQNDLWLCGFVFPDGRPEHLDLLAHDLRASRLPGILHRVCGDGPPGDSADLILPDSFVDDPVVAGVDVVVHRCAVDDRLVAFERKDIGIEILVLKMRALDEDPEIEGNVDRERIEIHSGAELDARRKRRPAHVLVIRPPGHPGGAPDRAGNPEPADVVIPVPAAIMEGNISPFLVRDPGPAVVGPDPMSIAIRPPAVAHMPGGPNVAVGIEADPASIGGQTIIKVGRIFLLKTGDNGTSPARGIADLGRRKIPSVARRDHKDNRNDPEEFLHIRPPSINK